MNLNQLQKHYDKLTPRERMAALLEAATRGDEQECAILRQAAPQKTYGVSHHYFLTEALQVVSDTHMMTLLNMGCAFYMGQFIYTAVEDSNPKRAETIFSDLVRLAESFRVVESAWRVFCEGEGLDPEKVLLNKPGSGVYSPDAPAAVTRADTLPVLRRFVETVAPDEPDPKSVAELAQTYRETFQRMAGEQSGGWG